MTSGLVERHPLKEKRRANKPLLERKRRARINDSLRDLKYLVLSSLNKDVSKFAKMEKVDILDMTVQYLKGKKVDNRNDDYPSVYRAGYSECANDVIRFVMGMDGVDSCMKTKILVHLAQTCQSVDRSSPPPSPTPSVSSVNSGSSSSPVPSPTTSPLKTAATFFGVAGTPAMETNRQVIVPVVGAAGHLAVLYASQADHTSILSAQLGKSSEKSRLQRPASDAPMASVKPTVRLPVDWRCSPDLNTFKKENSMKPAVWRPW